MNYKIYIIIALLVILINLIITYKEFVDNEKYTAIIIEPRKHKALEFVLNNALDNLSNQWSIILFHGNKNINFINDILNRIPDKRNRVTLINLNVDNLTIDEYSKLLATKSFYDNIPTEIFLIFQTDSLICNNYKDKLNNYLEYDYVGAPWPVHLKPHVKNIGNGGFSLRRKSKMIEIIDTVKYEGEPEDEYYGRGCKEVACNLPEFEKHKEFSNEVILTNNSVGIHKVWLYNSDEQLEEKYKNCPEIKILKELQS